MLTVGAVFAGYRIEGIAGQGGMGVVYRAQQERPARTVALKIVSPGLAGDPSFRARFEREANITASIEHSNVIPVYDSGEAEGELYLVMRYVPGTSLESLLRADGRLAPERAVAIIAQVCAALDAAHAHELVHRDVKPANVLISVESGREHVYLTDFGLAKKTSADQTATGLFAGSIDYAAPEQFSNDRVDARTDVYAVGAVLYHLLTGSIPYPADSDAAKMWAHLQREPPSIRAVDPSLPPELDEVVRRAMAKRPQDRFPSAGDLARAASAALVGTRVTEPERTVARGAAAPAASRHIPVWAKVGLPAGALLILAAVAAIALGSSGDDVSPREKVAACMRAHGMARPEMVRRPRAGESTVQRGASTYFEPRAFVSCTWPPGPGANPDGYAAVVVTGVQSGGATEATGNTIADRVEADCKQVELAYTFASMGVFRPIPPFRATPGTIWQFKADISGSGEFGQVSPDGLNLPFYPGRQEITVVHNDKQRLDTARCAA